MSPEDRIELDIRAEQRARDWNVPVDPASEAVAVITMDTLCTCGHPRWKHAGDECRLCSTTDATGAQIPGAVACVQFVAAAVCPNLDDPVLCSWHEGVFIPEAGCIRHDPEVRS